MRNAETSHKKIRKTGKQQGTRLGSTERDDWRTYWRACPMGEAEVGLEAQKAERRACLMQKPKAFSLENWMVV
jgi:hypothetical protein